MLSRVDEIFFDLLLKPVIYGSALSLLFLLVISASTSPRRYWTNIRTKSLRIAGFAAPILLLGYVSGYLCGMSRTSVVGNVIPAVLTLIAALNIYVFGKNFENKEMIGYSVILFSLIFFYGIQVGAFEREYSLEDRLLILSDQELNIRNYRSNIGLETDPPAWVTGVESKPAVPKIEE